MLVSNPTDGLAPMAAPQAPIQHAPSAPMPDMSMSSLDALAPTQQPKSRTMLWLSIALLAAAVGIGVYLYMFMH
jgi:hypothetical protein